MLQARFDTNEFGQYLGTATVIYTKASAASKAINNYNGASLDNRVMRVYYAEEPKNAPAKGLTNGRDRRAQSGRQERRENVQKVRRTGGTISKNRDARPNNRGSRRPGPSSRKEEPRRRFGGARRRNRGDQGRK